MVKPFEFLTLDSYIPAKLFRIIDKEFLHIKPGRTDILVKIVKFQRQTMMLWFAICLKHRCFENEKNIFIFC